MRRVDEPGAAADTAFNGDDPPTKPRLFLALLHHPVLNRNDEIITSQIDSFDFFDLSRLSLAYGIERCFFVNHLPSQRALAQRLVDHGRAEARQTEIRGAFRCSVWAPDLRAAVESITAMTGRSPTTVATSAKRLQSTITTKDIRTRLGCGEPVLLLFGKAWGLTSEALANADYLLEPIDLRTGYNHLSVRSAVSIIVDRVLGRDP